MVHNKIYLTLHSLSVQFSIKALSLLNIPMSYDYAYRDVHGDITSSTPLPILPHKQHVGSRPPTTAWHRTSPVCWKGHGEPSGSMNECALLWRAAAVSGSTVGSSRGAARSVQVRAGGSRTAAGHGQQRHALVPRLSPKCAPAVHPRRLCLRPPPRPPLHAHTPAPRCTPSVIRCPPHRALAVVIRVVCNKSVALMCILAHRVSAALSYEWLRLHKCYEGNDRGSRYTRSSFILTNPFTFREEEQELMNQPQGTWLCPSPGSCTGLPAIRRAVVANGLLHHRWHDTSAITNCFQITLKAATGI